MHISIKCCFQMRGSHITIVLWFSLQRTDDMCTQLMLLIRRKHIIMCQVIMDRTTVGPQNYIYFCVCVHNCENKRRCKSVCVQTLRSYKTPCMYIATSYSGSHPYYILYLVQRKQLQLAPIIFPQELKGSIMSKSRLRINCLRMTDSQNLFQLLL